MVRIFASVYNPIPFMRLREAIAKHKSVVESFFSLSILNGVVFLIPLIAMPYVLRVVGPANYGIYGFIYILVQYVLIVNNYGFDYSATHEIACNRGDKVHVNKIYNAVLGCRFLLFLAASALFFALSFLLLPSSTQRWMFIGGLTLVLGNTFTAVWLFQGMEKMRYMTLVNVLGKLLFLLLIFIMVRQPEDYVYLPLLDGLGYVTGGIASLIIARTRFGMRLSWPSVAEMKRQFRSGAAIFGSTLGMTLYRKSNIFILRFFVGDAALGLYTAAEKIVVGFQSVVSPVSQALFPHLGHDFAGKTTRENLHTLSKVSCFLLPFFALMAIITGLFSGFWIKLLCGAEFSEARSLLHIMSPILLVGGMNYVLGIVGLVNLNLSKEFFYCVLAAGLTSIAWVLFTAPVLGQTAGAWAMTLSESVLFALCIWRLYRLSKVADR